MTRINVAPTSAPLSKEDQKDLIDKGTLRISRFHCRKLVLEKPFWAAIMYQLLMSVRMGEGTAWTDGRRLVFDAQFIDLLTEEQLLGLILHELAHVVFMHHLRRGPRDGQLWNMAADYCINWLLVHVDSQVLPDGALLEDEYKDDTAEQAYAKLYKKYPPPPQGHGNPPGPCNGGLGGQQPPGVPGVPGQDWGEVRDATGEGDVKLTDSQKKAAEQLMAVSIRQAMNTARRQGKMPGGLREKFEGLLKPTVDWKKILNDFLSERFPLDYSWTTVNTRRSLPDSCLPGRDGIQWARVAVAIDTSGSVTVDEIRQMCSEIMHCLDCYDSNGQGMEIDVLYCDTELHGHETLTSGDMPYQEIKGGGGGTMFSPVMEEFKDRQYLTEDPAALIYMTDGCCDDFGDDPEIPVLWMMVGDYYNKTFKPPFGTVSRMELAN